MKKFASWFKRLLSKKPKSITMTMTDAGGKLITIHIPQGAGVEYTLSKSGTHLNVSVKDDIFVLSTNGGGGGGSGGGSRPGVNGGPGHTPVYPRQTAPVGAGAPNAGCAGDAPSGAGVTPPVGGQASFPIGARVTVSGGGRCSGLAGDGRERKELGGGPGPDGDSFVASPIRSSDRAYMIRGLYYVITTRKITGEEYPIHELLHWGKKSIELMGKFHTVRDAIDELKKQLGIVLDDITDYQVESIPKRMCKPPRKP
ncbi:hypothetical protein Peetri_00184 [Pseudomonas phage vB_PpuM-Peetri]